MKRNSPGLRAQQGNRTEPRGRSRLLLALPVGLALLGLWGAWREFLDLGLWPLAAGGAAAAIALALPWSKRGRLLLAGGFLALLAGGLLMRQPLGQGLRGALSAGAAALTRWHGYLHFSFAGGERTWQFEVLLGILVGTALGASARGSWAWLYGLLTAAGLAAVAVRLTPGWPAAALLCGTLLLLVWNEGPAWRRVLWGLGLTAALAGLALGAYGLLPQGPVVQSRDRILGSLHRAQYEPAKNPLPEGNLEHLGSFSPTGEGALRVTMTHWTSLYLKGFTGGTYTGSAWEPAGQDWSREEAGLTYRLQKDYFFPANQLAAANEALGNAGQTVTLQRLGACGAWAYTPYGGENLTLDPRRLAGEGTQNPENGTWQGVLYPASQAYLVQQALSQIGDCPYLNGENAYRERVYAENLQVPEETLALLEQVFDLSCRGQSTTQIRQSLLAQMEALLTYDESALPYESGDFVSQLLNGSRRGYSVHYATLATLLLRACGVPARYVEGYLVTAGQASAMADGESLVLTEKNAHAWAEFYLDGVGWLPFDTTPAHTGELVYALPAGGDLEGPDGSQTPPELPQTPQDQPQLDQQDTVEEGKTLFAEKALRILLLVLALLLLGVLLRAVLLRRRLRRHLAELHRGTGRRAVAGLLEYAAVVLACLGFRGENLPLVRQTAAISALTGCSEEQAARAAAMEEEALFSSHTMAQQVPEAAAVLDAVLAAWRVKRPWAKRIWDRWFTCRVL